MKCSEFIEFKLANISAVYMGDLLRKVRTEGVDLVCAALVKVEKSNKVLAVSVQTTEPVE